MFASKKTIQKNVIINFDAKVNVNDCHKTTVLLYTIYFPNRSFKNNKTVKKKKIQN